MLSGMYARRQHEQPKHKHIPRLRNHVIVRENIADISTPIQPQISNTKYTFQKSKRLKVGATAHGWYWPDLEGIMGSSEVPLAVFGSVNVYREIGRTFAGGWPQQCMRAWTVSTSPIRLGSLPTSAQPKTENANVRWTEGGNRERTNFGMILDGNPGGVCCEVGIFAVPGHHFNFVDEPLVREANQVI